MSKSVYVSKAAAGATVAVAALALLAVIGLVIFHHIRIQECPLPLSPTVMMSTTPAPTEYPPSLYMRLPGDLIPESYKIYLQTHLHTKLDNLDDQNYNFTGNCTVKFKCVNATNTIYIHSQQLNLNLIGVTDEHGKEMPVHHVNLTEDERDFVVIELVDTLIVDGLYYLSLEFQGECYDIGGLSVRRYTADIKDKRYLASTQLESTVARRVFPCFDEPAMKAVFDFTIIHRKGSTALSNMPQKAQMEIDIDGEKWSITEFYPTIKSSTYILSFVVFDFDSKETNHGRYTLKTWARPEVIAAGYADYAHSVTSDILHFFEEYCGINYPLSKLDQVALPEFGANAMENWGLITYAERTLTYNAAMSSLIEKELTASVIAHELAHQWFGNLVTMKWWNDLWLKEGFATYLSYLALDKVEPNMKDLIIVREVQRMLDSESRGESQPVAQKEEEVQSSVDIALMYSPIVYSKGAALLRMLSESLAQNVFQRGLQTYLKMYQYDSVGAQDLWVHLQRAVDNSSVHIPVAAVMETWTQQVGYPLITINTMSGEVSQKHFRLQPDSGHNLTWQVPIRVMKSGSEDIAFDLLSVEGPESKPLYRSDDSEWILANVNYTGYYRVNYDPENWGKLIQQLETDHQKIPVLSRAQLIDDAFYLARTKYVNITLALNTIKHLLKDTEFIPWDTATRNLKYLLLMLDRSEAYGPIQAYLRKLVGPLYDKFENFTQRSVVPDSHCAQLSQAHAVKIACAHALPKCQKMATDLFTQWRKDPARNPIHPNLRGAVYCSAIGEGGEDEWDFAWEMLKTSPNELEKDRLREALACSKHTWILNRYLKYALDADKDDPLDIFSTVVSVSNNVLGLPLAWDFVRSQWSNTKYSTFSLGYIIEEVTTRFSTEYELKQIKETQQENSLNKFSVEECLERVQNNINWVKENKQTVLQWFQTERTHGNSKA